MYLDAHLLAAVALSMSVLFASAPAYAEDLSAEATVVEEPAVPAPGGEPPVEPVSHRLEDRPFFTSVDNRISVSHIFQGTGPGHWSRNPDGTIDGDTTKQAISFTHFDSWDYGTNFLDVSVYKSGRNDPAAPCTNAGVITDPLGTPPFAATHSRCSGETEIYVIARSTLSWNKIFATEAFASSPLQGVAFEAGFDVNHQDDYNGAAKRAAVAGLQFGFELPYGGSLKIAPLLYYEFANHSRYLECGAGWHRPAAGMTGKSCTRGGKKHYKPTWSFEIGYNMDLGFLPVSARYFSVSGRATFRGPKGNQNSPLGRNTGGMPTRVELNSEPLRLIFDAGKAFGGPKYSHAIDVWIAYRYWHNKFGIDAHASPTCFTDVAKQSNRSCTESSLVTGVTIKL